METKENVRKIGNACTGCRACEQVCPVKCITMKENTEGFLYPAVDEDICIGCGVCLSKCAQAAEKEATDEPLGYYAFVNRCAADLFESASGGVSDVAAKVVLSLGGVVFGAAYTDDLRVVHVGITADCERVRLRSSKYVQSDTADCYQQAKRALIAGQTVLFTGTPCQIDGLKTFLGKEYAHLYTIDLICHGVPSPLFFQKYIAYQSKKLGGTVEQYNFRSKEKRGWGTQCSIKTKAKKKTQALALDKYGTHFMAGDCYRACCYDCRYSDLKKRPADLTIGDFWAVNKYYPKLDTKQGISSVAINTQKGKQLMDMMAPHADIFEITQQAMLEKQGNLLHPTGKPKNRAVFYDTIDRDTFIDDIAVGWKLKERIKAMMPRFLTTWLKKIL